MNFKYDGIPPNHTIVGTCSLCGGPVVIPTVWFSVIPPVASCNSCGATEQSPEDYGPIIPMNPPKRGYKWTISTDNKTTYNPDNYSDSWLMH